MTGWPGELWPIPVIITLSPWPSVCLAGDNGVSVFLIGLARFGSTGSVSGAAGSTSAGSLVFWP